MFPFWSVQPAFIPWDFALILIFLGAIVPWRGAVRIRRLLEQPAPGTDERLSLYRTTILFQWLIVAVVAWRAFSRNLGFAELGLTVSDPWRTSWIAVVLTALLCGNQWASLRRVARFPETQRGLLFTIAEKIAPRTPTEAITFAALACTAGLSEEFLYRGFALTVFARLIVNSALSSSIAAVLSSALFATGHWYQGRKGLITTFVVGMIFSGVRIWTGSLIPTVAAHIGIDLVAGLVVAKFIQNG